MILLDRRVGSIHLLPILHKLGHPTSSTTLPFGDAAFIGNGPDGETRVGIELKTLGDLLSCIVDKRLTTHQLPGLVREYDDVWIVVEGQWKAASDGSLLQWTTFGQKRATVGKWLPVHARLTHRDLSSYLVSLTTKAGVRIHRTTDSFETASFIAALYKWWQKPWADHHAHISFDRSYMFRPDHILFNGPDPVEVFAATILPKIGSHKCKDVARRFHSIREVVEASEEDWCSIPGIGPGIAKQVVEVVNGQRGRGRAVLRRGRSQVDVHSRRGGKASTSGELARATDHGVPGPRQGQRRGAA